MNDKIVREFHNLDSPAAYSSATQLKRTLKKYSSNEIRRALATDFVASRHKPRRYRFNRLKTIPTGIFFDFQADLGDFRSVAEENDGFAWCLVCIDTMSRQIFCAESKSKKSIDMREAFEKLFKKLPAPMNTLFTDAGTEFTSKLMKDFFKKHEIQHFTGHNADIKASLSENAIKKIKSRLYKYFEAKGTQRWVDIIDKITEGLNNSYHRILKQTPNSVNSKNWYKIWTRLYKPSKPSRSYYKIGDYIRVGLRKGVFHKGFRGGFSDEVFEIKNIFPTNPRTFEIIDGRGEKIEGKFYEQELSLSSKDTSFRIEKILKTRKRKGITEYFVKWVGHGPLFNSWISDEDFT